MCCGSFMLVPLGSPCRPIDKLRSLDSFGRVLVPAALELSSKNIPPWRKQKAFATSSFLLRRYSSSFNW
jgi:hypothetical protein